MRGAPHSPDMPEADPLATLQTRLLRLRGRVQGVGFREACVQRAQALGVTGWVRNRMDGSVEAMLQGPPARLDALAAWLRDDVPGAWVQALDVTPVSPPFPRFDRFERLPTL